MVRIDIGCNVLLVLALLISGCATGNQNAVVSSLGKFSVPNETVKIQSENYAECPSVAIELESQDMTIQDVLDVLQQMGVMIYLPDREIGQAVIRGNWVDAIDVVEKIKVEHKLELIEQNGRMLLVPADSVVEWIAWDSGRTPAQATAMVGSLGLTERIAVDDSGFALLGVPPDKVERAQSMLSAIDTGDDWLIQIVILDRSTLFGFNVGAVPEVKQIDGEFVASGGVVSDTFLFTGKAGAERKQEFGSRIPYRTSNVTETGVFLDGNVSYQEITSTISVSIIESSAGAKAELRIRSARPGAKVDGLFELNFEELDTEFRIRDEPIRVGSLRRWSTDSSVNVSRLLELGRNLGFRSYDVWFHAVRLGPPSQSIAGVLK